MLELDWGTPQSVQTIEALHSRAPDYIIAADCLYIDEVNPQPQVILCDQWHWKHVPQCCITMSRCYLLVNDQMCRLDCCCIAEAG